MKVFISHSSADKRFANWLAKRLTYAEISIWYSPSEIRIGDSIVEKISEGLERSDGLIIVLSKTSTKSHWVKEEINSAFMRLVDDRAIRLFPVLIEQCQIPILLRSRRYADFTADRRTALKDLIESISPMRELWRQLAQLQKQYTKATNMMRVPVGESLPRALFDNIYHLMAKALQIRCRVESRKDAHVFDGPTTFFEQFEYLLSKGYPLRSDAWNSLLHLRSTFSHIVEFNYTHPTVPKRLFKPLISNLVELDRVMDCLCTKSPNV